MREYQAMKNTTPIKLISLESQLKICEPLLELIDSEINKNNSQNLEKLYKVIIEIQEWTDKKEYDFFFDLGEYTFIALENSKNNKQDDGWMEYLRTPLLEALSEAKIKLKSK